MKIEATRKRINEICNELNSLEAQISEERFRLFLNPCEDIEEEVEILMQERREFLEELDDLVGGPLILCIVCGVRIETEAGKYGICYHCQLKS